MDWGEFIGAFQLTAIIGRFITVDTSLLVLFEKLEKTTKVFKSSTKMV